MRRSIGPLLCERHAHTRWSDAELTVAELVDLHGRTGFDVLCVTDHVIRSDDRWRERVAEAALPAVAYGDFHTPEHLGGRKTLRPSRHDETSIVEYLRSPRPIYLTRLDGELTRAAA
jgi:histidinol phosphatase-like PHP family hydrolase